MMRFIVVLSLITTILFAMPQQESELEKISLQLKWKFQFQFAGFIVAKEMGFYTDEGLDVELLEHSETNDIMDVLTKKDIQFGVSDSTLVYESIKGSPVVAMMAIFQESPYVLVGLKSSKLKKIEDLNGKKIAINTNINAISVRAMLEANKIDYIAKSHIYTLEKLFSGEVDLVSSYISNEPFVIKEKNLESVIYNPKDYGFDGYGDILFTTKEMLKNNPETVEEMYRATHRGWQYAFEHIDEVVELIYKKYNTLDKSKNALLYEANTLKKMSGYGVNFGELNKEKIKRIASVVSLMMNGKYSLDNLDSFIYKPTCLHLSTQELEYLKNKKELSVCVNKNWLPYESFEDGDYRGIGADFLKLYATKISLPIKMVVADNQSNLIKLLKDKQCDIKAVFPKNGIGIIPYNATKSYMEDSVALVTRIEQPYLYDIADIGKRKILIGKDFKRFIKFIKKNYPKLVLEEIENIEIALELVARGKVFGYIGLSLNSSHLIQKRFSSKLKIVNDFEKFEFGVGVVDSEPLLLSIFNKAIDSVSEYEKKEILNRWVSTTVEREPDYTIVFQILAIVILILLIIIYFLIKQKKLQKKLEVLNKTLELKVSQQVEEITKSNQLLLQKSRQAQMGEMITMIAHQWRQPLGAISSVVIGLKFQLLARKIDFKNQKELESYLESIDKKYDDISKYVNYLSSTIEDFKNLFKPNKEKELHNITLSIDKALTIIESSINNANIKVIKDYKSNAELYLYHDEIMQVVLNIIKNAQDNIIEKKILKPFIKIATYKEDENYIISISDNGGGIDEKILPKIFNPYFSTKNEKNGTGLGLYMSKIIVEKYNNGELIVENIKDGVCFKIVVKNGGGGGEKLDA